MQRMHAAKSEFKSGDIVQESETAFAVKSKGAAVNADGSKKWWYNVQLGNDHIFPTCECFDFQRYYLPCKHFFAIFDLIPGYSWESLPEYFRNSPFITIDKLVVSPHKQGQQHQPQPQQKIYENDDADIRDDGHPCYTDDMQEIQSVMRNCFSETNVSNEQDNLGSINVISQKLRSNLKLLSDFSYTCKEYSSLNEVNDKVSRVLEDALSTLPTEEKLILRMSPCKKIQKNSIIKKYSKLRSLPIKMRKKRLSLFEKYKNRVGTFADKVKVASQVNVEAEDMTIHNDSLIGKKITKTGSYICS